MERLIWIPRKVYFLFKYRPHQRELAYRIFHKSKTGFFSQNPLNREYFTFPNWGDPSKKDKKFHPNEKWQSAFQKAQDDLISFSTENSHRIQLQNFRTFQKSLQELLELTVFLCEKPFMKSSTNTLLQMMAQDEYFWTMNTSKKQKKALNYVVPCLQNVSSETAQVL